MTGFCMGATSPGASELFYDNINAAAGDIARTLVALLRGPEGLHAPTTLVVAGYMIGETLLRASGIDLTLSGAGQPIDHPWLTNNGLRLVQMLQGWFRRHDIVIADLPTTFARFGAALVPRQEPARMACMVRGPVLGILDQHQIGSEERVLAMALAATQLVLSAREIINPSIGAAVVVDALVTGARTIPLSVPETPLDPALCFIHADPGSDASSHTGTHA